MNNKYIVAKATNFQKELLNLKAAVAGISTDDYVNIAIREQNVFNFVDQQLCEQCEKPKKMRYFNQVFELNFGGKERRIRLRNIPSIECLTCDEGIASGAWVFAVQEIVNVIAVKSINESRGKKLIEEIDFYKLITNDA